MTEKIHEAVRRRYAGAASRVLGFAPEGSSCCRAPSGDAAETESPAESTQHADSCCDDATRFGSGLYSALELGELPTAAAMASLGCGNPIAVAELHQGERVLDLGSGGGIDVLLSARRVGPTGKAYGLDMTDEMLTLAAANAAQAGVNNVEWLKGYIESIPLPAESIDVVISNCVINLAADKPAVFGEIARVLRPGGRVGISDVVADDSLTPEQRLERSDYAGCIAGALSFAEYRTGLEAVGLTDVSLTITHPVADRMYSVIVKAGKPVVGAGIAAADQRAHPRPEPLTPGSCC
jgi:SAM-dependent methyltransferase